MNCYPITAKFRFYGEKPHQEGQILDILAVNFNQPAIQAFSAKSAMHGCDKR